MTCDEARELAPEAALDVLDPAERARLVAHVATCPSCRDELIALSATADALLLAVGPVDPPPGFESRALTRIAPRRRRWVAPALAAAVALVLGLAGGWLVHGHPSPDRPEAAWLLGANGQTVGQVLLSDGRLVCVLDYAPAGETYDVAITTRGRDRDLGRFTTEGSGKAWTADLPVHGSDVQRIVIRDENGMVRATATV